MSWRVSVKADGSDYFANVGRAWPTKEGNGINIRLNARIVVGPTDAICLFPEDDEKGSKFSRGSKAGKGSSRGDAPVTQGGFDEDDDIAF